MSIEQGTDDYGGDPSADLAVVDTAAATTTTADPWACCDVGSNSVELSYDDGSTVTLHDLDLDGQADVVVQGFTDGYVVVANPGPGQSVYEFDSAGTLIATGVDVDGDRIVDFTIPASLPDVMELAEDATTADPALTDPALTDPAATTEGEPVMRPDEVGVAPSQVTRTADPGPTAPTATVDPGRDDEVEAGRDITYRDGGGALYDLGAPIVDTDADLVADTLEVSDGNGGTFTVTDGNEDGEADRVVQRDASGTVTNEMQWDRDRGWEPVASASRPLSESAPVEVPPTFATATDPMVATAAAAVAEVWSGTHAGEPWPTTDDGTPVHPTVLLGLLSEDPNVPEDTQQTLAEMRMRIESAAATWTQSSQR